MVLGLSLLKKRSINVRLALICIWLLLPAGIPMPPIQAVSATKEDDKGTPTSIQINAKTRRDLEKRRLIDEFKLGLIQSALHLSMVPAPRSLVLSEAVFQFQSGDYISASGTLNSILRITPPVPPAVRGEVARMPVSMRFTPTGVAYDRTTGRVIIAAVSQILVVDPTLGTIHRILKYGRSFGFLSDVVVDHEGMIIAVDEYDQAVYRIELKRQEFELEEIAPDFPWMGPAFVDLDSTGNIIVLDEGAGPPIGNTQSKYDAIFVIDPKSEEVTPLFTKPGINGSGLAVSEDGIIWIASVFDLQRLDPKTGKLIDVCPLGTFSFANGIEVDMEGKLVVSDKPILNPRGARIVRINEPIVCARTVIASGESVAGATGIDLIPKDL